MRPAIASAINRPVNVMAIDPGLSGAVAVVGFNDLTVCRDFRAYSDIAQAVKKLFATKRVDYVVMELVGARPGQGVCSMFHFGEATGVALGALLTENRQVERVAPLAWKNWYRKQLGIRKGRDVDARAICLELFPQWACYFKRVKDHNTADALLMALWKLNHLN